MMSSSASSSVLRYESGKLTDRPDDLAQEEPLEIRVGGRAASVTMRTPGHDDELAAGFLLAEGVIEKRQDVSSIEHEGNVANVCSGPQVSIDFDRLTRHVFASSSCGLCGKATIEAIQTQFKPI